MVAKAFRQSAGKLINNFLFPRNTQADVGFGLEYDFRAVHFYFPYLHFLGAADSPALIQCPPTHVFDEFN